MSNDLMVSVIVPVYNGEKYIERCIDSLLNQTYKNIEILIVNDGSTDGTSEKLKKYYTNEKVIIINQKNGGVSKARNKAIESARGEYIQFTDSDDWLEKNMIEDMVKSAVKFDSDIVISEYKNYYENTNIYEEIKIKDYELSFKDVISDETTLYGGFPWNKMIRKKCITQLYDENIHFYENLLFFLENSENINNYSVVHKPLYVYNINDNSTVHSKRYNQKKISILDALQRVIQIVDEEYISFYKYMYISKFCENKVYLETLNLDLNSLSKYENLYNLFLKDLSKNNNLSFKIKIKLFIMTKLKFIYRWLKIRKLEK